MAGSEAVFFWISLCMYAVATGGFLYAFSFRKEGMARKATFLTTAALIVHAAAIVARTAAQGHFPWSSDYENGLVGGWFIVASTLFVAWRQPGLRILGAATLPAALLIMGYGVMRHPALVPMAATLKSFWLYIHVFFAWLSFGAYAVAMGAGVVYVRKETRGVGEESLPSHDTLPSLEKLDDLMFRCLIFGFLANAVMLAAGSIWARDLWGSYWSWDPVETWSLVSWLMYGVAIHLRLTMGWQGRRFAWLMIGTLASVIINFFGVSLIAKSTIHVFS